MFVGSSRNMLQHYQDAMAIVRKYEKLDIFITMNCNPNWREIKENLFPNQQPDKSNICARVFNIKKNYLIDVIVKQKFFGEVLAYVLRNGISKTWITTYTFIDYVKTKL